MATPSRLIPYLFRLVGAIKFKKKLFTLHHLDPTADLLLQSKPSLRIRRLRRAADTSTVGRLRHLSPPPCSHRRHPPATVGATHDVHGILLPTPPACPHAAARRASDASTAGRLRQPPCRHRGHPCRPRGRATPSSATPSSASRCVAARAGCSPVSRIWPQDQIHAERCRICHLVPVNC